MVIVCDREKEEKKKVGIENCSGKLQFEAELRIYQLNITQKHFSNDI